ncbi:MAG TPA: ATP-binding protein [Solirubrobacterales bacterium]|nr:ATP-binding protein [Solirubrobacterales bacterium]
MIEPPLEPGALLLAGALVALGDAVRLRIGAARRRERLNRALHELRRPLQVLALSVRERVASEQVALAVDALAELDLAINGGEPFAQEMVVEARALAERTVARWREAAELDGRPLELRWQANGTPVRCDPAAISRALDNLISNALEHGRGPIRLEGVARRGRLRLMVADGADVGGEAIRAAGLAPARRRDPRRGHGLRVVADIVAAHGGRFAACRHAAGASAVIELPLAGGAAARHSA